MSVCGCFLADLREGGSRYTTHHTDYDQQNTCDNVASPRGCGACWKNIENSDKTEPSAGKETV